jgi:hypothetical protein
MKSISPKEHNIVFLREQLHKCNHFLGEPNPKGAIQHICTNMLTKQHKHFPQNECSFVHDKMVKAVEHTMSHLKVKWLIPYATPNYS